MIEKLNKRITVYEPEATVSDGMGGYEMVENVVGTVWAAVEEKNGSNDGKESLTLYNITIRTDSIPVTTRDIIEYKGRRLSIRVINNDTTNRLTKIQAWG